MFYNVKVGRGLIFSINIMNSIDEYKQFKVLKSLPTKLYNPNSILKSVFNGEIIIFEKSIFINEIIKTIKSHFNKIFRPQS